MTGAKRLLAATVLAVVAAGVVVALTSPPAFIRSAFDRNKPSAVAGQPLQPVQRAPVVRIAVAGDTGTGTAAQMATARRMAREHREEPFDALLLLGDLVYEDGDAALVDDVVTRPFAPLLDSGAELLPLLGNHDYRLGEQRTIMTRLGRDRLWYVDRVGPVRVVVLDSNLVGDARQTRWLRRALARPQPEGTWTVVALHHPPYSAGYHGSVLEVRRAWVPLFRRFDVPLVLAGHEHDYQRSVPLGGVTYVISGAGAKLRPTGQADFTAVSSATRHFLDLLVYEDRLVGRAIDQQGDLVDRFAIRR